MSIINPTDNLVESSGAAWGGITGTLSSQTDLQTALDGKVDENAAIVGATKTKVTYDTKGLITAGADATTADIADSLNKRYVTDAQLTVLGNTSGTNSGNQTSIVGITGSLAEFNTALTGADFATGGGTVTGASSGTNTGDQTSIVGISGNKAQFDTACTDGDFAYQTDLAGYQPLDTLLTGLSALNYADATSGTGTKYVRVNATNNGWEFGAPSGGVSDGDKGDVTVSASGATWTIDNNVVTNAKLDDMAGHTVKARVGGASGDPSDLAMGSHSALVRNGGDIVAADAAINTVLRRNSGNTLEFGAIETAHLSVALAAEIAANTAKVTNATHTGDATGAGALSVVAIQGKAFPALGAGDDQKYPKYDNGTNAFVMTTIAGGGDVVGQASSVDSEIALFSGTGGKTIKRASNTGMIKAASGVIATATDGTDYYSSAYAIPAANVPGGITSLQSTLFTQSMAAGTYYYLPSSALTMPASSKTGGGMTTSTTMQWNFMMRKTAAGTGAFNIRIYRGTNGTTADTADVTQSIGTATAAVDIAMVKVNLQVTATGGSGSYTWSISVYHRAATAAGFGTTDATPFWTGTVSAVAMNTASLKFGIGIMGTTGTTAIVVSGLTANADNMT
jgi:hypothetical protein